MFNVWDRIETNEFAETVTDALAEFFPDDPPSFLPRTPHGYHAEPEIRADISNAGFESLVGFEPLDARSRATSCDVPAIAYCQGTPLRDEIMQRDPALL